MRFALPVLALTLGGCFDDTRTIELDTDAVTLPLGAGTEIGVWVDGHELSRLDAFSWHVDRPELVSIALTEDHARVRITGRREGQTVIHLGYRTTVIDVPATIMPAAVVAVALDPLAITAPIGAMVPVRATATYTDGASLDVSDSAVWTIGDASIASVEQDGVRGMAVGTTTLYAWIDGIERTATVTVAP
jgi:hypothetical protein